MEGDHPMLAVETAQGGVSHVGLGVDVDGEVDEMFVNVTVCNALACVSWRLFLSLLTCECGWG